MAQLVPWVTAMTAALPDLALQVDTGDYTTDVTSNLGMQAVGFTNMTEAQGIRTDLLVSLRNLVNQRVADGHGAEDLASLIELIRPDSAS